jgi:hypothetical protein
MKDTRPAGYPGTLSDWQRQCAKQETADRTVLEALQSRKFEAESVEPAEWTEIQQIGGV